MGHKWTIEFTTRSPAVPSVLAYYIHLKWFPIKTENKKYSNNKMSNEPSSLYHHDFGPQHIWGLYDMGLE